jgi:hypothetical protein
LGIIKLSSNSVKAIHGKNIQYIQIFGDFLLVIDSLKSNKELQTLLLKPVFTQVKEMIRKIADVTCTHVYRKLNCQADLLSKQVLEMTVASINITKVKDGQQLPETTRSLHDRLHLQRR